jgi:hypothetical protein
LFKNWALFHTRQLLWHVSKIHPSRSVGPVVHFKKAKNEKSKKDTKPQKKQKRKQSPEKFFTCSCRSVPLVPFIWQSVRFLSVGIFDGGRKKRVKTKTLFACLSCFLTVRAALVLLYHTHTHTYSSQGPGWGNGKDYDDKFHHGVSICNNGFFLVAQMA